MSHNTRYEVGDKLVIKNPEATVDVHGVNKPRPRTPAEVVNIFDADSDSPTYKIRWEDKNRTGAFKASKLKKADTDGDWKKKAQKELEEKLDVETEMEEGYHLEISNAGENGFSLISSSPPRHPASTDTSGEAENDESEWIVLKDYKSAKEVAIEEVKRRLEEYPHHFKDSFLRQFIYIPDRSRSQIANEEARHLANAELDTGDIEEDERVDREKEIADRIYDELENPIQYFVEDKGIYSKDTLLEQDFIEIDEEEASVEAVNRDGVAHFLDRYDGRAVELPSGARAYGAN